MISSLEITAEQARSITQNNDYVARLGRQIMSQAVDGANSTCIRVPHYLVEEVAAEMEARGFATQYLPTSELMVSW